MHDYATLGDKPPLKGHQILLRFKTNSALDFNSDYISFHLFQQ